MNKLRKIHQAIQRLFDRLVIYLLGEQCKECGSRNTKRGYSWTRGWNDYCSQAYGDSGLLCRDCHYIEWDTSIEEHRKIIPEWCRPYEGR